MSEPMRTPLQVAILTGALLCETATAAPAAECAFVASGAIDAVTVVDVARERVTGVLPVGALPVAVAISGDGREAWVANTDEHTVSVVDLATRRVVATVPVGFFPNDIKLHPGGERFYVADRRSDRLSVIDAQSRTVVDTIPTQGSGPSDIEITRDGTRAYVANSFSNRVTAIDLVAGRAFGGVQVGEIPFDVALSPDETHVYSANVESGSVSVIRLPDLAFVDSIAVGGNPTAVAALAGGATLYAVNGPLSQVSVIDAEANEVRTTIPIAEPPFTAELAGIALTADGTRAFTPDFLLGNLFAIDTAVHTVATFISVGGAGTNPQRVTVGEVEGACPTSPLPLLTADIGASETVVPLERPDLLLVAGTLRIDDELLTYDGRMLRESVINVVRGVEGTAAAAHGAVTPAEPVGQHADANCDGRVSAADVTGLIERLPSGDPGACGADVQRDGMVAPSDLPVMIAALFD
jgi:YVTN family beta-propeller protein